MSTAIREHWEKIYQTRQPQEVSWTQEIPSLSLSFIHQFKLPHDARIIDVGGGDSRLADYLLEEGFTRITVLDISEAAIERARKRLGDKADQVNWIVSDVLHFHPEKKYDLWHDRAAFHFQTDPRAIRAYLRIVRRAVSGMIIIGTFSTEGPDKCSGLPVQQYNEDSMKEVFEKNGFKNLECKREDHITPAGAVQNFVFCSFLREGSN